MTPRKTTRPPNRRYQAAEIAQLRELALAGDSQRAVARKMGRHPGSIAATAARLRIHFLGPPRFTRRLA